MHANHKWFSSTKAPQVLDVQDLGLVFYWFGEIWSLKVEQSIALVVGYKIYWQALQGYKYLIMFGRAMEEAHAE